MQLGITTAALAAGNTPACEQLALLIAAGRQTGGWEEWTPTSEIRAVCDHYGRADSNFGRTLSRMGTEFSLSTGKRNRRVRLKRPGQEKAAALVKALAGEA